MIPEWALNIFMKNFDLNRTDAIIQMKKQDDEMMNQKYQFDLGPL